MPSNLGGQILILEGPKPFLLEDSNDEEGQIGGEEFVFIILIQAWIDRACEKDEFPWQGLMVQDGTPSHDEHDVGKGSVILMLEGMPNYMDEKLEWLHW